MKINHILGVLLLITAVLILYFYNKSVKPKINFATIILLVLYCVGNGIADFSGKAFNKVSNGIVSVGVFNFYTYLFAFLVLGIFYVLVKTFDKNKNKQNNLIKKSIMHVIIMAVSLYLTTFFKTLAANHLPSAQLYPIYQASMLILNGAMGAAFFGEKITAKSLIAVVISVTGIVVINLAYVWFKNCRLNRVVCFYLDKIQWNKININFFEFKAWVFTSSLDFFEFLVYYVLKQF